MADELDRHYEGAGRYWNVSPDLLRAVHGVEDPSGDPDAVSKSGAIGHMQFIPDTAHRLGINPHDPVQSIYGAARLLRENLDRYGNVPDALRAYNAGTDKSRWGNAETMAYPQKVASNYPASATPDPFEGKGIDAEESGGVAATPNDAFTNMFGPSIEQAKPPHDTPDAFGSVFGSEDKGELPSAAHAHQGSWFGNLAQFGSDAADAMIAEGIKATANVVDGVTLHKLHGTEYDPRLFKKAAEMEMQQQGGDWGSGAAHLGGALLGDAAIASTVGRSMPSVGGGIAMNALTRGIEGGVSAKLVDQNPLLGATIGAGSAPAGAALSRAWKALRPKASIPEADGAATAEIPQSSTEQAIMPKAQTPPESLRLGLFASPKHADKLASRIWEDYQAGGPVALIESKIPGVRLTASQATGNAGLAQLERVRRSLNPNLFEAVDSQNAAARNAYARKIIGTDEQLEAAEAARDALEQQHREAAFSQQQPVDVTPVRQHLARLITDNMGRETVQQPLINVMKQLNAVTAEDGTALPDKLWNVRKYLGDVVSPKARGTANDGQAAASQLLDLKPTLTDQIDAGAPGFTTYLKHYEEMSRPIDAMRYLQGRKLNDVQGNVQLHKLDGFLDAIKREKGKPGVRLADSVTPEQFKALEDLRDDMRLASRIDLGKARGSDTNPNLMTTTRVASMAQGAAPKLAAMGVGLIEGGALGGLLANGAAQLVNRRMIGRMANTQEATLTHLDNALINPNRAGVNR